MYSLAPDEKTSPVMVYSHHALAHGELVTKEHIRINTFLRGENAPDHLRLLKTQYLELSGGQPRSTFFPEFYFPVTQAICIHLVPPAQEPLDYEINETNRLMKPVVLLIGSFMAKARTRVSSQVDFGTGLAAAHAWLSVYEAEINNPSLSQMPVLHVPMMIVRPDQVGIALQE